MTANTDWNLLNQLPKVDLHLHLDGCVKPETALELAREQGIALPVTGEEALRPYMQVTDACGSLKEYLSKFNFTGQFLQTGAALTRVAYEVVEQAADQRCGYIEVRFAPQLHRGQGLSLDDALHFVTEGLKQGEARFKVKARAIVICMRNHPPEVNREVIDAAARYLGRGVVAVDLAGDEASYPAELFRDTFTRARQHGIPVTIHAGEAAGPENIYEAITQLGAVRIGHGVRLQENPEVLDLIRERHVPLELCPISNIQTKAVSGWEAYPIKRYFEQGLLLTINTDNPVVSSTTITREYRTIAEKFQFTLRELAALIMNGVEAAFLQPGEKQQLRVDFTRRFKELNVPLL
ncbi:adenosine deaminase [Paenibacillus filicis]|uniref:adenosine deaminase n=1 Tax=Paenibacillus filicis TaxID=669464 RepID=A0ABU9DTG2_9BACL